MALLLVLPAATWADPVAPPAQPVLSIPAGTSITLKILNGTVVGHIPRSFFGVNVAPYSSISKTFGNYLNASRIHSARWPGGAVGDEFNYTANRITHHSGSSYIAPYNTSEFIAWCRSTGCIATFQLPGEINRSATAAYYVKYVEKTLGFHPDSWEIGNEPALWSHYDQPWSKWAHAPISKITPTGYAQLVQRYVTAIHAVDPAARILGLPGVGTGAYREWVWVGATVLVNGPNLSGVAIHAYPAGRTLDANGTLEQFYATLHGGGSLNRRMPLDRTAIHQACPTCHNLPLYVTEAGSATDYGGAIGGTIGTAVSQFPQVPYVAALSIQGLQQRAKALDFFTLTSNYPGALYNSTSGSFRPVAGLFTDVFPHLDRVLLDLRVTGAPPGMFMLATRDAHGLAFSLLVANTNTTTGARLPILGSGMLATGFGSIWTWTGATNRTVAKTWTGLNPTSFWVPPESVVLFKVAVLPGLL